jgi:hypothetical protein
MLGPNVAGVPNAEGKLVSIYTDQFVAKPIANFNEFMPPRSSGTVVDNDNIVSLWQRPDNAFYPPHFVVELVS